MSLAEIAKRADTSIATVSRVLNNSAWVSPEVRERVLAEVRRTGYAPDASARALAAKRRPGVGLVYRTIALAHSGRLDPTAALSPHYDGVLSAAEEMNLSITIAPIKPEDLAQGVVPLSLSRLRLDGILVRPIPGVDHSPLRRVAPVVVLGAAPTEDCPFSNVEPDSGASIPPIVDHLVGLGHRWIEFVSRDPGRRLYRERAALVVGQASLRGVRATVADTDQDHLAEYAARFASLPPQERPTALFASADMTAIELIRRLDEQGLRVPRDVSVAGCDGQPAGETFLPSITTALIPWREIGRCALLKLVEEIERPGSSSRTLLGGRLAVRQSTGPAPEAARR